VNRRLKSEQKADRKRMRRLERELHRKEKALAEISERYGFHLDQTVVQGYGVCEACRRKEAR
jgi:Fe2+ or Zn2+ uptake regulation protein